MNKSEIAERIIEYVRRNHNSRSDKLTELIAEYDGERAIAESRGQADKDCICRGNWRTIAQGVEPFIGRTYRDVTSGHDYRLFGLVDGGDDYYYGMYSREHGMRLLSCVGSIEGFGLDLLLESYRDDQDGGTAEAASILPSPSSGVGLPRASHPESGSHPTRTNNITASNRCPECGSESRTKPRRIVGDYRCENGWHSQSKAEGDTRELKAAIKPEEFWRNNQQFRKLNAAPYTDAETAIALEQGLINPFTFATAYAAKVTKRLAAALMEGVEYLADCDKVDAPIGYELRAKWERLLGEPT